MMKRVIVAGASGFVGKALTKYLIQRNIEVYAIVRDASKLSDLKNNEFIHILECEFSDVEFIAKNIKGEIDAYYYTIWQGGVYGAAFKDYELQLYNSKLTCDALLSAMKLNCNKFICVGTVNEYEVCDYIDSTLCKPRLTCIYSTSKLASRLLCKTLAYNNNIDLCFGILAKGYGPGDTSKTIINIVINKLIKGENPDLIKGENLYDFIYIDDIAEAFYHIGDKGKNFKSYYVGNRNVPIFKDFITKVRDIINPNISLNFGAYPDDALINYDKININELYEDTGFEATTDFKESILKTAEWVKTLNI